MEEFSECGYRNGLDPAAGQGEIFRGYLIGYGNKAELMVNTTTDPEPMVSKIRDLKPGGGAALYDAIYMACTNRALLPGEPFEPRRVLVVIGDGNDNSSKKTLAEALEVAQKNLVTIYGISTTSYGFYQRGQRQSDQARRGDRRARRVPAAARLQGRERVHVDAVG